MKKTLWLAMILSIIWTPAQAADSRSSDQKTLDAVVCVLGWVNAAGDALIFVPGEGYKATLADGTQITLCSGTLLFGETMQVFDFFGNSIIETVGPPEVMCSFFPEACRFGVNGIIRLDFASTGSQCPDNDEPSTDWQQLVTPSGRTHFICRSNPSESNET